MISAPRWPPQQQPQLQYNYDSPVHNVIEEPTQAPSPPPPRYSYSRPHYEAYEPEQPADIPVVVGTYVRRSTTTTTTPPPPPPPTQRSYFYEDIDIITAPPVGGHRHYGNTYEVQVSFHSNFRAKIFDFLKFEFYCRLGPILMLEQRNKVIVHYDIVI